MKCAVYNCRNSNVGKASPCSFFRFPTNAKRLEQWIKFCGRTKRFNPKTSHICMEHFTVDDFENSMKYQMGFAKKRLLKPDSIPTIYKPLSNCKFRGSQMKRSGKRKNQDTISLLLEEHNYAMKAMKENNFESEFTQPLKAEDPSNSNLCEDHVNILSTEIETLRRENERLNNVQRMQSAELKSIKKEISKLRGPSLVCLLMKPLK